LLYVAKPEINQEIKDDVGATNSRAFYVLQVGDNTYQLDYKGEILSGK